MANVSELAIINKVNLTDVDISYAPANGTWEAVETKSFKGVIIPNFVFFDASTSMPNVQ